MCVRTCRAGPKIDVESTALHLAFTLQPRSLSPLESMGSHTESLGPLLRCNDPPSPFQKILVEEILRDKQAELSALGDEISRLESALQTLRSNHAELAAEMTRYTRILSPIRHLPPEIVGEIFLCFSPSMNFHMDLETETRVKLPWKLAHICRLWRTISFSLGQLWAVLDLGYPWGRPQYSAPRLVLGTDDDDDEKAFTELPAPPQASPRLAYHNSEDADGYEIQAALDLIEGCVGLSGSSPLSLRLWMRPFAVFPVLKALLKSSARWQEIVLVDPPRELLNGLSKFDGNLQGLQKIAVAGFCEAAPVFHYAPNLTDLTFLRIIFSFSNGSDIPWSRLTRYCEIDCYWAGTDRLASYRRLTNLLVLCLRVDDDFSQSRVDAVILPNLRAASFHLSRSTPIKVVQYFEMPMLEAFSIEHSDAGQFQVGLPSFSPRLKILRARIHYPPVIAGNLECTLEMFPDLTELSIDVPYLITNASVSRLVPYNDRPPLASKLEILRLSNRSFRHNSCEWRTLADMLQARFRPTMPGISRLQTFEFPVDKWANDGNVTTALQTLRAQNRWNIKVGGECMFPAWDDLYLTTV
ncbi:hypothetical protein MVEN_01674100 [Mycena venus]|uniref:F-box domain-containing protein n=1 Tax=Mycena venus TaxID=2733690 RepID=A0A8H6XQX2_9AGAR|nr:hypothetical protein MVEN_01674100 [Mycena venus]